MTKKDDEYKFIGILVIYGYNIIVKLCQALFNFSKLPDCFDTFNPQFGQSGCTPHDDAGNSQDSAGISSPQIEGAGGALRLLVMEVEHVLAKPLQ